MRLTVIVLSLLALAACWPTQIGRDPVQHSFRDRLMDGDEGPELVPLPTGSFLMGSPVDESGRDNNEGPQLSAALDKPFAIMKYEVTLAEYRRFVEATARRSEGDCYSAAGADGEWIQDPLINWLNPGFAQTETEPVVCVSWDDAVAYAEWLTVQTGKTYRLPSETEWEYAAKANQQTANGAAPDTTVLCSFMNGADATAGQKFPSWKTLSCSDGYANTAPVGSYSGNAFGVFDMIGNVWEWVADCYTDDYTEFQHSAKLSPASEACSTRTIRGGSWSSLSRQLRAATRVWNEASVRANILGFRLVRLL